MTKSYKSFCFPVRGEFGVRHARIGSLASSSFSLIHNPNGNREHAFQHSLSSGLEKDLSAEGQSSLCSDKERRALSSARAKRRGELNNSARPTVEGDSSEAKRGAGSTRLIRRGERN
jgi:hypothetical protein